MTRQRPGGVPLRGPVLFVLCLVAGATVAVLAKGPAPAAGDDRDREPDVSPLSFLGMRDEEPAEDVETLEARGVLRTTVQACALAGSCQVAYGSSRAVALLTQREGLARLEAVVEWRPASAATRDLIVELLACGDPCSQDAPVLVTAVGSSPQSITFEPLPGLEPWGVSVRVRLEDGAPGPSEAYASPADQPFAVVGAAAFR